MRQDVASVGYCKYESRDASGGDCIVGLLTSFQYFFCQQSAADMGLILATSALAEDKKSVQAFHDTSWYVSPSYS